MAVVRALRSTESDLSRTALAVGRSSCNSGAKDQRFARKTPSPVHETMDHRADCHCNHDGLPVFVRPLFNLGSIVSFRYLPRLSAGCVSILRGCYEAPEREREPPAMI